MKNFYRIVQMLIIALLVAVIPLSSLAQEKKQEKTRKNAADSYKYWYVGLFGGIQQFNGDLSERGFLNIVNNADKKEKPGDYIGYNFGLVVGKQFTRVVGVRARIAYGTVKSKANDKFCFPYAGDESKPGYVSNKFESSIIETDLQVTINWLNWILGYKPERLFSSYIIAGVGLDQSKGTKWDLDGAKVVAYLGHKDDPLNVGGTHPKGIGGRNLTWKASLGLGVEFNISKHWAIPIEFLWRWQDTDALDMTNGGSKQIKNDMYSSATVGVNYKFGYGGCSLKTMEKRYDEIKYDVQPQVLSEKGDSVIVTVRGTVPEKYFCKKAAMYFQPVLTYAGGQTELKPFQLIGESVTGDGTMIRYKEGGTFTYTTVFPYKPEMNTSMLSVEPVIYEAKEKVLPRKEEIKEKVKFAVLPSRDLAPGVIYTPTRFMTNDMVTLVADHGYQKEVLQSKNAVIYFKKNKYDLDLKYGINKTDPAKNSLTDLGNFVKQGWKIKDITMNGWASPEGEETFNANLSENRSKTGNKYMIDLFQSWVKEANKDNKDKKAVKAAVEAAGKDVNMVLQHHGPDWNGFLRTVQNSNLKDKSKILNVINSTADQLKKEQEIRNMILIYPEIEENLLPPLRRSEITATLYEPRLTDAEISEYAVSSPEKLKVEELLYAATLTSDENARVTILENAARLFPNNWKTLNNAAVALIAKGHLGRAGELLNKAQTLAPNNGLIENNLGVVAAKHKDLKKAETLFKKAATLGENTNYNLGILQIPKGDYPKALNLLGNSKCNYNLGLAQLVSGNNQAAETTLKCAPQTPETHYLLAIVGARTNNTKTLYENLMKACQNPELKAQAKGDREFYNFANSPDFQNIVK